MGLVGLRKRGNALHQAFDGEVREALSRIRPVGTPVKAARYSFIQL